MNPINTLQLFSFNYMVMGGVHNLCECANSTRFFSTIEEAQAYSASIVENKDYDYTQILETRNITDSQGGFCYMIIGAMEDEGDYIETVRLFSDLETGYLYGDSLTDYDFTWAYRITVDGEIDSELE